MPETEVPAQVVETETPATPAQVAEVTEVLGADGKPFDPQRAQALIQKLQEENKQLKPKAKLADELSAKEQARIDAELSETERLKKQVAELENQNAKAQMDIFRRDVIAETGLPAIFADRLKGATKDEMLADAKSLAETLPTLKTAPKLPINNPQNATQNETDAQKRERLFGRQGNAFDMQAIQAGGGGVVWNKPPE